MRPKARKANSYTRLREARSFSSFSPLPPNHTSLSQPCHPFPPSQSPQSIPPPHATQHQNLPPLRAYRHTATLRLELPPTTFVAAPFLLPRYLMPRYPPAHMDEPLPLRPELPPPTTTPPRPPSLSRWCPFPPHASMVPFPYTRIDGSVTTRLGKYRTIA
jgi:hypothetical protein